MQKDIKNFTLEELRNEFIALGLPRYCANQVFGWLYQKRVEDFSSMTDIAAATRLFLAEHFYFSRLTQVTAQESSDGTKKFLFSLADGHSIEAVFIPEASRATLCVSSQVGCKFACSFCTSGTFKFTRNLTVSEIINQYLLAQSLVAPAKISNIVFMGIGEPLDNFTNVVAALRILMDRKGLSFPQSKISLSTCGLVPQIKELAVLGLGIKLSISLHAASDTVRSSLMPINKKYPLKVLLPAAKYIARMKFPVMFEYVMMPGVNTARSEAAKLAKLLRGLTCKVNLITFNAGPGTEGVGEDQCSEFQQELHRLGVFFTLRKSRGQDIQAACGQLCVHYSKLP